jgi:hypothetical protein
VEAVATANERAVKQAEVLANQMANNAEILRASVAKTAETIAAQLQQTTTQQNERIAALEKANYENVGKAAAPSEQVDRIASLERDRDKAVGRTGVSAPLLIGISVIVGGILAYIIELLMRIKG